MPAQRSPRASSCRTSTRSTRGGGRGATRPRARRASFRATMSSCSRGRATRRTKAQRAVLRPPPRRDDASSIRRTKKSRRGNTQTLAILSERNEEMPCLPCVRLVRGRTEAKEASPGDRGHGLFSDAPWTCPRLLANARMHGRTRRVAETRPGCLRGEEDANLRSTLHAAARVQRAQRA